MENKAMQHPFEIVSYVRKKTFAIEAHFTRETEDKPLSIFKDPFSRFTFVAIADKKAVKSNVPIEILADAKFRSQYAYTKQMEAVSAPVAAPEGGNSIAYTTRFMAGSLKGKSPMDVLIENGKEEGGKILNKQYQWLKQNLEKFKGNQKMMDAIVAATKEPIPETAVQETASAAPITIIDIGCRPLTRKTREDGKCFCYECKVTWDTTKNYPVTVRVANYYAPVEKKENGMLNVKLSGKDVSSEVANEFAMTAAEWMNALERMQAVKDGFERMYWADSFKLAEKASFEAAEAARNAKIA